MPSKIVQADHHKHGSTPDAKRRAAAREAIIPSVPLPVKRPAAASLPPDVVAVEQAIELVRQRKVGEATALATSIGDPVAQKIVEWALSATPTAKPDSSGTLASSAPIRTGRAFDCCAGAPRRDCGRSGATPPPCAVSSAPNRSIRLGRAPHRCAS
jgi:hypothetical protein